MNKGVIAGIVFFFLLLSIVVSAPVTAEYSVVVPQMQKSIEKQSAGHASAGVTARVYIKTTVSQS